MQPNENLYDQKPEEPAPVSAPVSANLRMSGQSFPSRFEYVENTLSAESSSGGPQALSHVTPPKSSSFFEDYGMDSGFQKKSTSSSKVQVFWLRLYSLALVESNIFNLVLVCEF